MAEVVDRAVGARFLEVLAPEEIALALAAADEVTARKANRNRSLELRVERTRYEAARAERAFHHCDPDNRLVARSLERRWEEKLRELAEAERELAWSLGRRDSLEPSSGRQVPGFLIEACLKVTPASMPDASWAVGRTPPNPCSRDRDQIPVSTSPGIYDTSSAVHLRSSPRDAPDEVFLRLFPQRSPPGLFTLAACGGLKPAPAGRLRGAFPHLR